MELNINDTHHPEALAQFNEDIRGHELIVMHEGDQDGVYRHLVFKDPERDAFPFEVVTWPGNITITGDMGTVTFRRIRDMLCCFDGTYANVAYWSRMVTAESEDLKQFDYPSFRRWVMEHFWSNREGMSRAEAREAWSSLRCGIVLKDSELGDELTPAPSSVEDALEELRLADDDFVSEWYTEAAGSTDAWMKRDLRFLWNCYALMLAKRQYHKHINGEPTG